MYSVLNNAWVKCWESVSTFYWLWNAWDVENVCICWSDHDVWMICVNELMIIIYCSQNSKFKLFDFKYLSLDFELLLLLYLYSNQSDKKCRFLTSSTWTVNNEQEQGSLREEVNCVQEGCWSDHDLPHIWWEVQSTSVQQDRCNIGIPEVWEVSLECFEVQW